MEGGTGENVAEKRRIAARVSNRETWFWAGGKLSRLPGTESFVERVRKGAATGALSKKSGAAGERRTGLAQGSSDEGGPASEHAKRRIAGRHFARIGRAANARARNARHHGARAVQSVHGEISRGRFSRVRSRAIRGRLTGPGASRHDAQGRKSGGENSVSRDSIGDRKRFQSLPLGDVCPTTHRASADRGDRRGATRRHGRNRLRE